MMRKNDANHEIEIPITKTQVPNKFQFTMSKNGKTSSRLIWDLIIGTYLGFGIPSGKRLHFYGENRWKIAHDWIPRITTISRCVNLTSSCAEINAAGIE